MGLFSKIKDKLNEQTTYIVNKEVFREFLNQEINFSEENDLESVTDLTIFINGEQHNICIWDFTKSNFKSEQVKGKIFYFDKLEYRTLDELWINHIESINGNFKIILTYTDSKFLNEYRSNHPDLKEG